MKPRVLMIAYACDPRGTGEHWLGWGWAEQAAQKDAEVKSEIRNPKSETSSKPKGLKVQNQASSGVFGFCALALGICFGFRISDFGFSP